MASKSSSLSSMRLVSEDSSFWTKKGDLVKRALCAMSRVWPAPLPIKSSIIGDLR